MANCSFKVRVEEADLAREAAQWMIKFWPEIVAEFEGTLVTLSSKVLSSDQLQRIWKSALLNEKQVGAARLARRSVLEALVR